MQSSLMLRRLLPQTFPVSRIQRCPPVANQYNGHAARHIRVSVVQLSDKKKLSVREKKDQDEKALTFRQEKFFDELAKEQAAHDKKTFLTALKIYEKKNSVYKRGHVEFIYASLNKMKDFGVHKDIDVYRHILDIFPKETLKPRSAWDVEFMHYPKQQQCCIDVLEKMEDNGVIPDDKMGYQLGSIFGYHAHAFRRYRRMMYWMPKMKNANPFPIPLELPSDRIEIAKLALQRMAVDKLNKIQVYEAGNLETAADDTFIVSAQSPDQIELLKNHNPKQSVYVEGGFNVWLRHICLKYFILRSDVTPRFTKCEENEKPKDTCEFNWNFGEEETPKEILDVPTMHEQNDGTILAMCVTGTSSKDSLASWVTFLEKDNPILSETPVVFLLRTPEAGIQVIEGDKPLPSQLEVVNS